MRDDGLPIKLGKSKDSCHLINLVQISIELCGDSFIGVELVRYGQRSNSLGNFDEEAVNHSFQGLWNH